MGGGTLLLPLLQLRKLGFGLFENGDAGVGIFPEREEILVCRFRFCGVAAEGVGAAQAKLCQRMLGRHGANASMIDDLLKFRSRFGTLPGLQVGQAAQVVRQRKLVHAEFVGLSRPKRIDGLLGSFAIERNCGRNGGRVYAVQKRVRGITVGQVIYYGFGVGRVSSHGERDGGKFEITATATLRRTCQSEFTRLGSVAHFGLNQGPPACVSAVVSLNPNRSVISMECCKRSCAFCI